MTNAKNPPELPNPQGVTASGRFEATKPTAAPIARWQLAKIQGELRHIEFFRVGVQPTRIECSRVNGQYQVVTSFRCIDHTENEHTTDGVVYLDNTAKISDILRRNQILRELPLTVPRGQAPYSFATNNEILGAGELNEDAATSTY